MKATILGNVLVEMEGVFLKSLALLLHLKMLHKASLFNNDNLSILSNLNYTNLNALKSKKDSSNYQRKLIY